MLGKAQRDLLLGRRIRRGAVMGIDEQQVDSVGTDVENSHAHVPTLPPRGVSPCP